MAKLKPHCYLDYRKMLEVEKDNIDAVLIATPFTTHYDIVMDCLSAGKYVFCEKTMADTVDRCRNIVTKCHETGKFVQCGHQRRYNPEYIHMVEEFEKMRAGRVQYIEGQWHRNGDWRRPLPEKIVNQQTGETAPYEMNDEEKRLIPDLKKMVNWRIYEQYSAGLVSELATHHIEVVNWMMGTPPARVIATGGTDYWKDDRDTYDNVVIVFEYDVKLGNRGHKVASPKTGIEQADIMMMRKPYTVRFSWTGTLQSSLKGEGLLLAGDVGTFEMHERGFDGSGRGCWYHEEPEKIWLNPDTMEPTTDEKIIAWIKKSGQSQKFSKLVDKNPVMLVDELGGEAFLKPYKNSDIRQFEAFAECIRTNTPPRTNQMCGLMASICDIAAHEASVKKEMVAIDPAWYTFDFETPDPFLIS
jgi:predicted dehydrogenase